MREKLLVLNHGYLFFGTTVYVGVLWALHFFWYPSWEVMGVETVQDHFINPTSAATDFFWIVVPLMFIANVIMIVTERKHKAMLWTSVAALVCISAASYVGQALIIPVNDIIAKGITDPVKLKELLQRWMVLNDIRWVIMSAMWLVMMYYFVAKGNLLKSLADRG